MAVGIWCKRNVLITIANSQSFNMNLNSFKTVWVALIAVAIYLKPASGYQAVYGDGYVYVVDLQKKNISNIIPGKTVHP